MVYKSTTTERVSVLSILQEETVVKKSNQETVKQSRLAWMVDQLYFIWHWNNATRELLQFPWNRKNLKQFIKEELDILMPHLRIVIIPLRFWTYNTNSDSTENYGGNARW